MSIRLNKALSELNIGLQTAVEFLEKRSELGEVKQELSFKLNDQQSNALVEAFKQDLCKRLSAICFGQLAVAGACRHTVLPWQG